MQFIDKGINLSNTVKKQALQVYQVAEKKNKK